MLDSLAHAITDVNNRLERLYDAIETGKLSLDDVVVRIRELRQRQEELQKRKIEIESQMSDRKVEVTDLETISQCVDDLQNLLKEGALAEQKAFIKSFVKEIRVTGNEAVLSYFPPHLPEKLVLERTGVPPTVQYGGQYRT